MSTKIQECRTWGSDRRQLALKTIGQSMRKLHPVQEKSSLPDDMRDLLEQLERVDRKSAARSA